MKPDDKNEGRIYSPSAEVSYTGFFDYCAAANELDLNFPPEIRELFAPDDYKACFAMLANIEPPAVLRVTVRVEKLVPAKPGDYDGHTLKEQAVKLFEDVLGAFSHDERMEVLSSLRLER
jgi:hypothetical protein